jgi:lysophospholipase L1-like esterase
MKLTLAALPGAVLAAALVFPPAAQAQVWNTEHWTGTWGAAPAGPPLPAKTQAFSGQTLRLVVHTSIGGNRVRIRLSNEMGSTPLLVGGAHIAVRASGVGIAPGTDRPLTFNGAPSVTIAPGAPALSDAVDLNVPALSDLAVSLWLPGTVGATTAHATAGEASYVSLPGDFTGAASLPTQRTIVSMPFLTEVDVDSRSGAIVTFGDTAPDTGKRWPDWLARRLQAVRDPALGINGRLAVVDRGIGGNRLLESAAGGRSALERFDRDVLATAGVRYVVLQLGLSDIGSGASARPASANALIAGYRQLIARAHDKGIAVFGATLTPFEGAASYSPAKEQLRQEINQWIRANGEFDGVIDFDQALRDPARLARLLPAYDSGDHVHPNELGVQAMGDAVPLALFRSHGPSPVQATATIK